MIYAAATLWLMIIVLLAWGVHHLWCGLAKPRNVNIALAPGSAVVQLARTIALLLTGATVRPPTKKDEKAGGPKPLPESSLPIIGPVIVALLPIAAIALVLHLAVTRLGTSVLAQVPDSLVAPQLPTSWAAFWDQLRNLVTLAETTLHALRAADAASWQAAVFAYVLVCLTVRLAPLPGNIGGHIAAVFAIGIVAWLASSLSDRLPEMMARAWPLITLTLGAAILLMMASLAVRGAVEVFRAVTRSGGD